MKVIHRGDRVFKVIPDAGVVVGEAQQSSIFDELNDVCTFSEMNCIPINICMDSDEIGFTYKYNKAKAKCDPRDKWSEKVGIDIVSAKLDMKEHLRKARKLERTLLTMNSALRKIEDILNKHLKKAKAIRKDLENYYGGIYK